MTDVAWLLLISLLVGIFTILRLYLVRYGSSATWMFALSITVFMSLVFIGLWLAIRDSIILVVGLGLSALTGIAYIVFQKSFPFSDVLTGQIRQIQSDRTSLTEEERNRRKQTIQSTMGNAFLIIFLQRLPLIIGIVIILLSRGTPARNVATTVALFIMGFTGILRIVLRPASVPLENYSKSKTIGNILITVFAWSLAVYNLFNG